MIGIYKIKNLINNKIYIGQSVDITRRWAEHRRSGQPKKYSLSSKRDINSPIHLAMQKYGIENFEFSVVKECEVEALNELERYYISFYHSTDKRYGYNISLGGQDRVGAKGELHSQAKLNQKQVDTICQRLIAGESVKAIHADYNFVNKSIISMINQGHIWKNPSYTYPLSQQLFSMKGESNGRAKLTEETVMQIRKDYVNLSFSEVCKKYAQYKKATVRSIVYGESWKHLPIYKKQTKTWIEPCIDYPQSLKQAGE